MYLIFAAAALASVALNVYVQKNTKRQTLIDISMILFQPQFPVNSYRRPNYIFSTGSQHVKDSFYYLKVKDTEESIACHYISNDQSNKVLIFSHGNAEDIGQNVSWLKVLAREANINIFLYEYEGYSHSTGTPSEAALERDITTAYNHLRDDLKVKSEDIYLFGRSLGGGPTVYLGRTLSEKKEVLGGIILMCTFTSPIQTQIGKGLYSFVPSLLVRDMFDNFNGLKQVDQKVPLLMFHGRNDEIVPYHHGEEMYEMLKGLGRLVKFVPLESGHNDIISRQHETVFEEIKDFVNK
ncbi:Abhd17c [Acrasis kona]|uniref:Abhd17c n=1 Tax=Acrasis kona TaxID=1008807 RepID=A0AAW2Z6P2_9EUKA